MGVFDQAKDKAEKFMGDAKEKLGQQNDQNDDQREGANGKMDDLRDKAGDAMKNAKDRFQQ